MAFSAGIDQRFIAVSWGGISVQFGWGASFDAVGHFNGSGQFYIDGVLIEEYEIDTPPSTGWVWSTENIRRFLEDNDIDIPEDGVITLSTDATATFTNGDSLSKSGSQLSSGVITNKGDFSYLSSGSLPECGFGAPNFISLSVSWALNIKTGQASLLLSNPA